MRILLLGGTSETASIATRLADAGLDVLVSTATDEPLRMAPDTRIARRVGRLNEAAMADLVRAESIGAIVDAGHPYAAALHATAASAAKRCAVPCVRFVREATLGARSAGPAKAQADEDAAVSLDPQPSPLDPRPSSLLLAADHERAAEIAFSLTQPAGKSAVLLTTGSTNLGPYVRQSQRAGVPLAVRVLPRAESIEAALRAGVARERIIAAKGPFTVEANREHIRKFDVGVVVTKDSGQAGGTAEKLEAARLEGCRVVVVQRPARAGGRQYRTVDELVVAVVRAMHDRAT